MEFNGQKYLDQLSLGTGLKGMYHLRSKQTSPVARHVIGSHEYGRTNGKAHQEDMSRQKGQARLRNLRAQILRPRGRSSGARLRSWRVGRIPRNDAPEFPKGASDGRAEFRGAGSWGRWAHRWPCWNDGLHQAAASRLFLYVKQPEKIVPGRPLFYATAFTYGRVCQSVAGWRFIFTALQRLKAIDKHPASLRGMIFFEASILEMHDPDRSQTITIWEMCGPG